ncbi:MAG: SurA N-terminal domain-containing protein, partial [Syntrophaceae bacterium]|nr:SurA N-terminal domain-containing protein [Syntrophaceae bacterium]
MAKVLKTGLAAVLIMLLATAALRADVADRIVAVVNDEVITLAELNRAFEPYAMNIEKKYKGPNPEEVLKQNRAALLQRMIDQMLIEHEAKKAGGPLAVVTEEEIMNVLKSTLDKNNLTMDAYLRQLAEEGGSLESVKKEIKGQILRMRLLRREVQSKVLVPDEAIGEYYNRHR